MIGMTIDFGWPWWAFTAIAVGVAAASAVLFVLVHERFPRGVLATLLLEGIVIAAVAPAVMTNSNASTSAMSANQFAQQADANCRALAQQLSSLGNPKTLPGIARKLDVVIPAVSMALRAQAALQPPAGKEGLTKQWMQGMTRYRNQLTSLRTAAKSGNGDAVTAANQRVGVIGGEDGRLSKRLGLGYCFQ
jgi:hypothetical protein